MSREPIELLSVKSTMGLRIRLARTEMSYSQKRLAQETGIPLEEIAAWENDERYPTSTQIIAMTKACGVKSEYFFRPTTILEARSLGIQQPTESHGK